MARWGRFLAVHASLAASLLLAIAFATAQQLPPTAKSLPAQQPSTRSTSPLTWSTDSATAHRFVSVHGRSAAIFGSADAGLEIWTYPTQIFSGFTVSFRHQGTSTAFDGRTLLRRIVYRPESVTRIYAGPDFIVREKLFVPLNLPGAILRYEVDSTRPVDIVIGFVPVLDLMWPGSLGGQDVLWDSAASGYRLFEPTHRFTAMITSADIVAHDDTPNTTLHPGHSSALAFTLRAGANKKTASVLIAGSAPGQDARDIARQLADDTGSFVSDAVAHYDTLLRHSLQIETPDAEANRALSWAEIALDQAWVCNPDLGCGLVGGYGPSRRARRPQYDWFFAGDGMVTLRALLASGQYDHVREELEFILKYQDQKTGMIWHELSQSAGQMDWAKYPYMFVHVDLTFDFLTTLGSYLSATGDRDFPNAHWPSIQSAYAYCRSLVDSQDALPHIPADKLGQREQDSFIDELTLSASWASAAQAFADLAAAEGHKDLADESRALAQHARDTIPQKYWDEKQNFWIAGHTRSGAPTPSRNLGPVGVLSTSLFSPSQRDSVLNQISSADFQADWGTRGRAANDSTYDPNSYASGSVWATGTSATASAFWAAHRPATALPIWTALIPWSSLDSLGHMHEALAGDYYHEEMESVPEQTWSSATFFAAAVHGMLGLQIDGASNHVTFTPHLPPTWNSITLRNIKAGASEVSLHMTQTPSEIRLQAHNEGAPVQITFDPEIPFGAKVRSAQLRTRRITAETEPHPQDTHAKIEFDLPHGDTSLAINYTGGVAILPDAPTLAVGDPNHAIKITATHLDGRTYTVDFDVLPSAPSTLDLRTPWKIENAEGATFQQIGPSLYRLTINPPKEEDSESYQHGKLKLTFARDGFD